jgi:hypothetical protein
MTALDTYRRALKDLDDPEPFLLERSCLELEARPRFLTTLQ